MALELARAAEGPATAAASQPVLLEPGRIVRGDYEVLKPLGKGKFSIVYMAKRLSDNYICALKKINIFEMMVPKQRDKCLKEVRLLESLEHPHIVKLLTSFVDNKELFIIVDWAEKGDLKRLIRRAQTAEEPFPEASIWQYSKQLAGALDHMHGKRIMHRDLKPANIFVAKDNSLKLGDLGLGRFFNENTLEAFTKVGTPLYMSPEVLHGAGYDMRSDVWSLGCVIYELAMLRSPFKSDQQLNLYDLFVRISKGDYPPIAEMYSVAFRNLCAKMLELKPEKRWHTSQVVSEIDAYLASVKNFRSLRGAEDVGTGVESMPVGPGPTESTPLGPRPSPLLVMDDIVDKLKLLSCEEIFLRPLGLPLLHRCFFVQPLGVIAGKWTQFDILTELIFWLLGMLKARDRETGAVSYALDQADASAGPCPPRGSDVMSSGRASGPGYGGVGAGDAAAGGGGSSSVGSASRRSGVAKAFNRVEEKSFMTAHGIAVEEPSMIVKRIMVELKQRNVQVPFPEITTMKQLEQGYGEAPCLVVNELINQELIGRDFHFECPEWNTIHVEVGDATVDIEDEIADSDLELADDYARQLTGADCDVADEDDDEAVCEECPRRLMPHCDSGGEDVDCFLEPIHFSSTDPAAWREEVERVKPLLMVPYAAAPGSASACLETVKRTARLARDLGNLLVGEQPASRCCQADEAPIAIAFRGFRNKLADAQHRIVDHEVRLNAAFAGEAVQLREIRDQSIAASSRHWELQARVMDLSAQLSSLEDELNAATASIANQSEAIQDSQKLIDMRRSVDQLRAEDAQLRLRVLILQRELFHQRRETRPMSTGDCHYIDPKAAEEFIDECSVSA